MSTTRITVDPDDPATFPKGRFDAAVVERRRRPTSPRRNSKTKPRLRARRITHRQRQTDQIRLAPKAQLGVHLLHGKAHGAYLQAPFCRDAAFRLAHGQRRAHQFPHRAAPGFAWGSAGP